MSHNSPTDKNQFPHILDVLNQEHWHLKKLLVLLIIISVASLGSLSVAQHFLPANTGPIITPTPTYTDGVCDADPAQMKYVPIMGPSESSNLPPTSSNIPSTATPTPHQKSSSTAHTIKINDSNGPGESALSINSETALMSLANPQVKPGQSSPPPSSTQPPALTPNPLPPEWYMDNYTDSDADYARACAATFVNNYHTFDARDPKSFEAAAYMLNAYAKKLFYQGGPDNPHNLNLHMLANWQNQAKQRQQRQQTSVDRPRILNITPQYSKYVVYLEVGYNLTKEIAGQVSTSVHHDRVILQNTTPSPKLLPKQTTGWQVIDWIDGDA